MNILTIDAAGNRSVTTSPEAIPAQLAAAPALLWVDLAAAPDGEAEPVLRDTFGFHPLAVDDALNEIHIPKIDDWGEYVYAVLRDVVYQEGRLQLPELDIFLGQGYLVSYHQEAIPAIDRVWQRAQKDSRVWVRGADYLFYQLFDELVEDCMKAVDEMLVELEAVEAATLTGSDEKTLAEIMRLRRQVLQLRRVVSPQREVAARLAREPFAAVNESEQVFFRDVYDHLLRLNDLIENMRDLAASTVEIYLSVINNRMNDIMKTLTIITTLFLPLTFLTGFFGMNFFAPEVVLGGWTGRAAFFLTLVFILAGPLSIFLWIRRRGWMA